MSVVLHKIKVGYVDDKRIDSGILLYKIQITIMYLFQIIRGDVLFVFPTAFFDVLNKAVGILIEEYVQIGFDNLAIENIEEFAVQHKFIICKGYLRENERFENIVIGNDKLFKQVGLC